MKRINIDNQSIPFPEKQVLYARTNASVRI